MHSFKEKEPTKNCQQNPESLVIKIEMQEEKYEVENVEEK